MIKREDSFLNPFNDMVVRSEADSGGGDGGTRCLPLPPSFRPLFFAITCFFFKNHFEELQTVLFEVEPDH